MHRGKVLVSLLLLLWMTVGYVATSRADTVFVAKGGGAEVVLTDKPCPAPILRAMAAHKVDAETMEASRLGTMTDGATRVDLCYVVNTDSELVIFADAKFETFSLPAFVFEAEERTDI